MFGLNRYPSLFSLSILSVYSTNPTDPMRTEEINALALKNQDRVSNLNQQLLVKDEQLKRAQETIKLQNDLLRLHGINVGDQEVDRAKTLERLLCFVILTEEEWNEFKKLFNQLHFGFCARLKMKHPTLTQGEVRLAILIKLELSNSEVADKLGISTSSVIKSRYRLKKKLIGANQGITIEQYFKPI